MPLLKVEPKECGSGSPREAGGTERVSGVKMELECGDIRASLIADGPKLGAEGVVLLIVEV